MIGRRAQGPSPFRESIGLSRAVRVGPITAVSGTGSVEPDGSTSPGDAAEQARRYYEIVFGAHRQVGALARDVVRTRMYLTDDAREGSRSGRSSTSSRGWRASPT